jgi:hypothetical protein
MMLSDQMTTVVDGVTIVKIATTTRRGCSTPCPDSLRTDLFVVSSAQGWPCQSSQCGAGQSLALPVAKENRI